MKKIYEVGGILNKGFIGQISYTVCLDKEYRGMDIEFSFDKQRYSVVTEDLKEEIINICNEEEYGQDLNNDEKLTDSILGMKTEIHTIATMNDKFIGGIHKQLTSRHMYFSPSFTSEGCITQTSISGVIKITLIVFNVLLDHTNYLLTLSVEEPPA